MTIKRLLAAFLCLLILAGCGAQPEAPAPEAPPAVQEERPEPAPQTDEPAEKPEAESDEVTANLGTFEAQTLQGDTLTQEYFANAKLTLINVWATFCGPCQREMPDLGNLDREMEDLQVLGIVVDVVKQDGTPDPDQIDTAIALAEATGVSYPSLVLNESLAMLGFASLPSVPTTIFVDENGNFVGQGLVGAYDEATWREIIAERLEMIA